MVEIDELRELIGGHQEWLLIRTRGRTFPLDGREIEIDSDGKSAHFGFLDDKGFHTWRINSFKCDGGEIAIDVAGAFAKNRETMRLVPRTAAAELSAEIMLARLVRANEIASLVAEHFHGSRIARVALNEENGRFAQISFETIERRPTAAFADVTAKLTVELILAAAILWLEKLSTRKNKPVTDLLVVCERRQARNAQKLHALLNESWREKLTIAEIDRKGETPRLVVLPKRKIRDLWREKAPKLKIPAANEVTKAARDIIDRASIETDIVHSRQGETLRYLGLPFARLRTMLGKEKAWFGVGRVRRPLETENRNDLAEMVTELETYRSHDSPNTRHQHYRAASEAWLESILRRDIRALDSNLILSPIYHQFRSLNDKIDLLALRRDRRLVIIEVKTQPDRASIFQAIDYWRKIELQRRRGILAAADLFEGREILDKPALIYIAAPAWSFHRDFEFFARATAPEIELWRFELHENWREKIKVVARQNYTGLT